MLDLLVRAGESEPYRTPEVLAEIFALPPDTSSYTAGTKPSSAAQATTSWDLSEVIERLRSELGEPEVAPARDSGTFAQTWPHPEEPELPEPQRPEPQDESPTEEGSALQREERLTARYRGRIAQAAKRNDDAEIARVGREAEAQELPLDTASRRVVRFARERIAIRSRLERALRENDRSTLAELAHSGELVVLGDTDRQSLARVLQALEWPGLLRAIEADDDAIILNWYDEELFGAADALLPEMRARVDLARKRMEWLEAVRVTLRKRDARALESLLGEEPSGGLERLSRGERSRVLRLIEQRAALNDLHVALREADTARILAALGTIDRVGARIENPATWAAVQDVMERATILEQIVEAAEVDPPDDRQLAHLLPVAKTMGLAHDPMLRDDLSFERLEAVVLRGAALRRIRQAIAGDDDQAIRQAAYPDVTGALDHLTDDERERVEIARARRGFIRSAS